MAYINQRQMETLSTSLKPSTATKKKKTTQGKVVPVMKRANPYQPRKPQVPAAKTTTGTMNPNQIGANKQQEQIQSRQVSPQISVNYESDPVLARIRAIGTQDVANARSEAAALRKQAIIDSGLADVGQEIGLDASTLEAARQNPFSTSATIQRTGLERGRELDESLNQSNLFYSGHRANQLAELARSQAEAQAGLNTDIRSLLGGINSNVMEAEANAALREQEILAQIAEEQRQADLAQSYLDALAEPSIEDALGQPNPLLPDYSYVPEPIYQPPALTPEEELLLALGAGNSAFTNYAI